MVCRVPTRETEAILDQYRSRLQQRRAELGRQQQRDRLVANLRLAAALAILVLAWLAFGQRMFSPAWLAVAAVGFAALVHFHHRVVNRRIALERAARFYEKTGGRFIKQTSELIDNQPITNIVFGWLTPVHLPD